MSHQKRLRPIDPSWELEVESVSSHRTRLGSRAVDLGVVRRERPFYDDNWIGLHELPLGEAHILFF